MTKALDAPSDTRTHRNPSANDEHTVDYREAAKKLAAESYQARIHRFRDDKASHPIAKWGAGLL